MPGNPGETRLALTFSLNRVDRADRTTPLSNVSVNNETVAARCLFPLRQINFDTRDNAFRSSTYPAADRRRSSCAGYFCQSRRGHRRGGCQKFFAEASARPARRRRGVGTVRERRDWAAARLHVFGSKGWAEARDETTLTVAPIGEKPDMQIFPQVDSLAVLLEAFAESVETGIPFPVSTTEMLDVAGAFEAVVRSMTEGGSVTVRRT
jgi:hypothetical protein